MKFPHQLFKKAGLNSTDIAKLFGVSRVTGARWLSGVDRNGNAGAGVNIFLQEKVEKIATGVNGAVETGYLPDPEIAKLPPDKRLRKIKAVIRTF